MIKIIELLSAICSLSQEKLTSSINHFLSNFKFTELLRWAGLQHYSTVQCRTHSTLLYNWKVHETPDICFIESFFLTVEYLFPLPLGTEYVISPPLSTQHETCTKKSIFACNDRSPDFQQLGAKIANVLYNGRSFYWCL